MKITEAIAQESFTNEYQKLIVNLIYTHNWMTGKIKHFLSEYDLTIQQFNVLRITRGQHPEPVTVNLLRERMLDKMSDASRVVERLRLKGFLEREKSRKDRRTVEVKITQKGLDALSQIDERAGFFDQLLANISEENARLLNEYLDQIRIREEEEDVAP